MTTIKISNARARKPEWSMAEPVDFTMEEGEHIAIIGRNGSGKSMFVDILTGRHPAFPNMVEYGFDEPYNNLKHITFRDTYGGDNDRTYFLQQRWNQMEIDEETPTVGSKLEEAYKMAGEDTPERRALQKHIYELFQLEPLLDKYIILLSSGELRKYKLASSLFTNPKVLIMENPFIGLDAKTRDQLKELMRTLTEEQGLQIILVLAKTDEIPEFITHIVEVREMKVKDKMLREEWLTRATKDHSLGHSLADTPQPEKRQSSRDSSSTTEVIHFNKVTIRYGARTILKDLDWIVRRGEHWALSGDNGSGKSTLLSLVCADNPQAYANDIVLFGRQRGTGESIWDIKHHIGYVSPEMHRAFLRDYPAIEVVASGLHDAVGLYKRPRPEQMSICEFWMDIFGVLHYRDTSMLKLSSGEQRLVLLARAFVKDPSLLILDEPLHGLDLTNRRLVKDVIETFCQRSNKTLVMVTHYQEEFPKCIQQTKKLIKNP